MAKFTTPSLRLINFMCARQYPYFNSIIFNLIPVERKNDPIIKTMAVDQHMRIYYNPEFLESLSADEAVGVLVHEINHLLRDHLGRGKNVEDSYLWNLAGDCEINDDIVRDTVCSVKLPKDCVTPSTFKFKNDDIVENYYELLKKKSEKEKQKLRDMLEKMGVNPGYGNCGSVATGKSGPGEDPFDGKDASGEGNGNGNNQSQTPGHSDQMVDLYKKACAEEIASASKNRGTIPAYLDRWAKKFLKHKVDWKKEVKAVVRSAVNETVAGMVDFTYKRPNRRQAADSPFIMPGLIQPLPKVGMITDTSGSMSEKYLCQAQAETTNVLSIMKSEVIYVTADADVTFLGTIRDPKKISFNGGGGTDMRIAYKKLEESKYKPNLVVCITDGFTPWPDKEIRNTRNLIVLLHENEDPQAQIDSCPKWAKVIPVRVGDEE
jgi:predicted metal-dependent peptidase